MLTLRPYQEDVINKLRVAMRSHKAVLAVSPCGSGKTALATKMLGAAAQRGKRSFFICHRAELIEQTAAAFKKSDISFGYIASGYIPNPYEPIQIVSIDTLKGRLDKVQSPDFCVWDEVHHCRAAGWSTVRTAYDKAHHVGLTATPERLDGLGLGSHFTHMVKGPTIKWLIDNGYLCDYKLYAAPRVPDFSQVHTKMGDYDKKELTDIMDKPHITGDAISHYQKLSAGKRAVVFCVNIEHSRHVTEQFKSVGISAEHLDGKTPKEERRKIINRFRIGQTKVLCNVGIISEGFDLPGIETVIVLRPTASLGLYVQMVGRALRPVEGKPHAIILDHAGNAMRHGLPDDDREWTLEGKKRTKKDKTEVSIRQCPQCYAVHHIAPSCPNCGFVYVVNINRDVQVVDGELEEVDKDALRRKMKQEQGNARTLDQLVALAKARKYKNPHAWAGYIFTARQAKKEKRGN